MVSTEGEFSMNPTVSGSLSQEICDMAISNFYAGEIDRIELVYTKFVSLIACDPSIRTLLPLAKTGLESEYDEMFRMTTKDGKMSVEIDAVKNGGKEISPDMLFEQEPSQLINAIMPLFLNSQILRACQESQASELASRMTAMQSASDNAASLIKELEVKMNRARQAIVTQELAEIVAGAEALV